MSKRQILILLGIWFAVFLFLGLPESWHTTIAAISGLVLIIIAYSLKSEAVITTGDNVPYAEHKSAVVVSTPESQTTDHPSSTSSSSSSINNSNSSI